MIANISQLKNYMVFNEDMYDFDLDGGGVDAIITDPPYNISKDNNFSTMGRQGVDFGKWDKGADIMSWIPKYAHYIKENGCIIVFTSYQYLSHIYDNMQSNGLEVKDIIVWQKANPMPRNIERRYVQDMEFALWGVKKGAKWTFNKPKDVPYLRSLYRTPTVAGKERTIHPTQKPLSLLTDLINIHTNKGDTILDPFMGSGTTGVASLNTGCRFIGIEKDKQYYDIAFSRINEAKKRMIDQKVLF